MNTIIGRICRGGAKSFKYLLAGMFLFALAGADTAQAGTKNCYWTGASSSDFATSGNWGGTVWKNNDRADNWNVYCAPGTHPVQNKTIVFGGAYMTRGMFCIGVGTEDDPMILSADSAGNGIDLTYITANKSYKYDKNFYIGNDGYAATKYNAAVKFKGGTYKCSKVLIGAGGENVLTGVMIVDGTDVATTIDANLSSTADLRGIYIYNGKILATNATFNVAVSFQVGAADGGTGLVEKTGGDWNIDGDLILGNNAGATGTFTQNGGMVTVANNKWTKSAAGTGTLNLNGGTFVTQHLEDETAGGTLTVNFNGGTLKANSAYSSGLINHGAGDGLSVNIGANGGTIDTGAFDISIPVGISAVENTAGGLTLTGGGSVALTGTLSYTGVTTNGAATAISTVNGAVAFSGPLVLEATSKLKISRNAPAGVSATAVELPDTGTVAVDFDVSEFTPGTYPILTQTGAGTFSAADVEKFAIGENAPKCSLSVSGDNKSIVLTIDAVTLGTWTGEGDGIRFSDTGNWSGELLPTAADDVVIGVAADTNLLCDIALNVNSITFPSTCALVTIGGTGCITNATTIVNESSSRNVIDVPVEFVSAGAHKTIDVTGEVDFQGGVTGTLPENHSTFYGNYTLTATDWNLASAITLKAGAKITASELTLDNKSYTLNAESGSSLTVKNFIPHNGSASRPFGTFAGTFSILNQLYAQTGDEYVFNDGFTGVLRVKQLYRYDGGTKKLEFSPASTAVTVVGGGFGDNVCSKRGLLSIGGCKFGSYGDWEFDIIENGPHVTSKIDIGSSGIEVDTSDYDDPGAAGHEVRVCDSCSYTDDILTGDGAVAAKGNGSLVFVATAQFKGGLTASDSVTVGVNSGAYPGKGDVTMTGTSTLHLRDSNGLVSGTLTMAGGTTLKIPALTAGSVPLSVNALAFDGVTSESKVTLSIDNVGSLAVGVYAVLKSETDLPADAAGSFALPEGCSLLRSTDAKSLLLVVGNPSNTYIGGSAGSLGDGANWLTGSVPTSGDALIYCASAATLTNGAGFAPDSITFQAGCAEVTINGEGTITGIAAITNLSSVSHIINVPVHFTGDIQVKQEAMAEVGDLEKAHITFAGGAYAAQGHSIENGSFSAIYSRCMFGNYYLDSSENATWTARYQGSNRRNCLGASSSLTVPYISKSWELYIGTGSAVTAAVASVTATASSGERLCYRNYGEFVITGELTASGTGGAQNCFAGWSAGTGASNVFKIEKATCTRDDRWTFYFAEGNSASHGTYWFGKGGINFGSGNGHFGIGKDAAGDAQTIRPWYGDFAIETGSGNTDGYDIYMCRDVTFNTDDENGVGRTITLNARPQFKHTPTFTVSGSGKVLVNSVANNDTQPPVMVTGTATLAMKPGASLTTSNITVNAGATLEVAEPGTVTLGGDLSLDDGATLAFNFTGENGTLAPKLDVTGKTVTAAGKVKVKVTGPRSGEYQLTDGGNFSLADLDGSGLPKGVKLDVKDGDIYLTVRHGMLMLIK